MASGAGLITGVPGEMSWNVEEWNLRSEIWGELNSSKTIKTFDIWDLNFKVWNVLTSWHLHLIIYISSQALKTTSVSMGSKAKWRRSSTCTLPVRMAAVFRFDSSTPTRTRSKSSIFHKERASTRSSLSSAAYLFVAVRSWCRFVDVLHSWRSKRR